MIPEFACYLFDHSLIPSELPGCHSLQPRSKLVISQWKQEAEVYKYFMEFKETVQ